MCVDTSSETVYSYYMIKGGNEMNTGRYAVALIGTQGWRRDGAIGDGITTAQHALVSRHSTRQAAEAEARRLNDAQPHVMPGTPDVPVYDARVYRMDDYLSRQDRLNGRRRADIRHAGFRSLD